MTDYDELFTERSNWARKALLVSASLCGNCTKWTTADCTLVKSNDDAGCDDFNVIQSTVDYYRAYADEVTERIVEYKITHKF